MNSNSDLKKEVQVVFNKWVRDRDCDELCLACKTYSGEMDASHLIAQGSSSFLRYHPHNVNNTCVSCNRFMNGNIDQYEINLIEKIGKDSVNWLHENKRHVCKYSNEQLENIIHHCKHNTFSVKCWYETMYQM